MVIRSKDPEIDQSSGNTGVSGALYFSSGTSSSGNSGAVIVGSGEATDGRGG
jgi:hypothetical protein